MKKPGIVLLLAILVSLVLSTPALASPSFSDVPNGSAFYQYVTRLAEQGIVSGFPAASFHPYDFITRQQLAKMIVLATHTSIQDATSPPIFTDLSPHLGRPYPYDYVVAMFRAGFFAPMGDTARPLYEMTRTHLAIVLVRAGGSHLQDPPAGYTGGYDDPPNFSADAVLKAKYNGLLDGVTPTRMEPFSLVTRGQACKAVARLMEKLDAGPTVTQPSSGPDARAVALVAHIQAKGVDVKDWGLAGGAPSRLNLTVGDQAKGENPFYAGVVFRAVLDAIKHGAPFQEYQMTVVGPDGQEVGGDGRNAQDIADLMGLIDWSQPASTAADSMATVQTALSSLDLGASYQVKSATLDPEGND